MTVIENDTLQARLSELAQAADVPGASLAVYANGQLRTATHGVLNVETGVEVTPESVFRIASITKVYTATAIMRLVDDGKLDLDAPVVDVLPELRVADPDVTARVTARHLLTHTSGISGDVLAEGGRGDDALERFVAACADVGQDVPLGTVVSYSNTGFSLLSRMIERITGSVWDVAMRDLLFAPLGLKSTVVLPEDALRFRVSYGHETEPGEPASLYPVWSHDRAMAGGGSIIASAEDVIRFARLILDGGCAPDGTRLLSDAAMAEMLRPQQSVAEHWLTGDHWGLGWQRHRWSEQDVWWHDGTLDGQYSWLRVVPERGVAIALLTNGGRVIDFANELYAELLEDLCEITVPAWPQPSGDAGDGLRPELAGVYERHGVRMTVGERERTPFATIELIEPLRSQMGHIEAVDVQVRPSDAGPDVYVGQLPQAGDSWLPMVFFELDGDRYVQFGARASRKVA